jgi:CheY-like chemotaxis protein
MAENRDSRTGSQTGEGREGRILVVEDDPLLRRVIVKTLQTWGYASVEAPDGVAALEEVERSSGELSVILLDIMLPRLDGLEVARRVGAERPELPIVACSAALTEGLIQDLREAGVRVFLPKPYSAQALRAILVRVTLGIDAAEPDETCPPGAPD